MTSLVVRAAGFFGFWLILTGFSLADLGVGLLVAAVAARASLSLLPPGQWRPQPLLFLRMGWRFLNQSVSAGIDVAWRALNPRLALEPGFVVFQPRLPPGPARNTFCAITTLLPGTLPCGEDANGDLVIHCLVAGPDVAPQLATEEALFLAALGGSPDHG
ncbi:MAG TPA: Na+/H+ antiporter subunit E [Hyphomicrobiaceae bacterium]|nr:Na+/H+ antiporter subunit E [Hyphomicrobiaceae bacterium]